MNRTKWWKCDLQVATPAWDFQFAAGANYRLDVPEERVRFLDDYMRAVQAAGIEVIALADHNTGEWIDETKAAGNRHGVVVFPGCEITTHTGADGVHLVIVGDLDQTSRDFDLLIHGSLGFNHEHPPFRAHGGERVPGSSSKTLNQILDDLPDRYLAIAPHALTDNGIASSSTVKGDLRWKALHHARLVAIDPGDCTDLDGDGFNARFRRRELNDFPRLGQLAFVSTSDAYSLEAIGSRYTWIRMGEVGIEALRQAFLDHESRVLPDWSPALARFPDRNPNNVRHAWISSVHLGGQLSNSTATLTVPMHPNLNVIIGGRGSGKSTVVAALRQLYSDTNTLPTRLKSEADSFVDTVFDNAELSATHRIQESQQEQHARWQKGPGRTTMDGAEQVATSFAVTVISQKELFERAAGDKNDPQLSSRSLLALIDGSIGYSVDARSVDSFGRRLDDSRVTWANAVREHFLMSADLAQLPGLRQHAATLQGQVDAFSSAQVKERLARIEAQQREERFLIAIKKRVLDAEADVRSIAAELLEPSPTSVTAAEPFSDQFATLIGQLQRVAVDLSASLSQTADSAAKAIAEFDAALFKNPWTQDLTAAHADLDEYKQGLAAQGLSTSEFGRLQDELARTNETIRRLEEKEPQLAAALGRANAAWQDISNLIQTRRDARQRLLDDVHSRSGRLRFKVELLRDTDPWVESLRSLAGIRADAFLEDVPALASWLWKGDVATLDGRWQDWRTAMSTGDVEQLQRQARLRPTFADRLAGLEETVRLRLASLIPDDVVMMEFLRENGSPARDEDWQSITRGSPGQRTAAMLAFVLHHGREPLVLDQPEDDLDSEWISKLVVKELRQSRWHRQLIVVSHNANIPVLGDAEQVVALENRSGALSVRATEVVGADGVSHNVLHIGPVENAQVRSDIQSIMEGGVAAFVRREQKYNNETRVFRGAG